MESWVELQLFGEGSDQEFMCSQTEPVVPNLTLTSNSKGQGTYCLKKIICGSYFPFYIAVPESHQRYLEQPELIADKLGVCIQKEMTRTSTNAEKTVRASKSLQTRKEYDWNIDKWHIYFEGHIAPEMRAIVKKESGSQQIYLSATKKKQAKTLYINYHLLTKAKIGKFLESRKKTKLSKQEKKIVDEAAAQGKPT